VGKHQRSAEAEAFVVGVGGDAEEFAGHYSLQSNAKKEGLTPMNTD
jgi:hypothetical protein